MPSTKCKSKTNHESNTPENAESSEFQRICSKFNSALLKKTLTYSSKVLWREILNIIIAAVYPNMQSTWTLHQTHNNLSCSSACYRLRKKPVPGTHVCQIIADLEKNIAMATKKKLLFRSDVSDEEEIRNNNQFKQLCNANPISIFP